MVAHLEVLKAEPAVACPQYTYANNKKDVYFLAYAQRSPFLTGHGHTLEIKTHNRFQWNWRHAELNLLPEIMANCGYTMAVMYSMDANG